MASEVVRGEVSSAADSSHVFQGNEILKVSVVNASRMDAPSISLGEQKITLQQGQTFPIPFQFSYDKSRAGTDPSGLLMQARIQDKSHSLIYINDTRTRLVDNVKIDVVKA